MGLTMLINQLSLVIWVPVLFGLLVLATGDDRRAGLARWIALAGALVGFALSVPLFTSFTELHGLDVDLEACSLCQALTVEQ